MHCDAREPKSEPVQEVVILLGKKERATNCNTTIITENNTAYKNAPNKIMHFKSEPSHDDDRWCQSGHWSAIDGLTERIEHQLIKASDDECEM